MMKKALLYVATAIILGTVTMVAPLMLLKPNYYELITSRGGENITKGSPAFVEAVDGEEGTFGDEGALERAVSPSNLSSVGWILIPSFFLALSVSLYLKKRVA
jgi:hypothetical protein